MSRLGQYALVCRSFSVTLERRVTIAALLRPAAMEGDLGVQRSCPPHVDGVRAGIGSHKGGTLTLAVGPTWRLCYLRVGSFPLSLIDPVRGGLSRIYTG